MSLTYNISEINISSIEVDPSIESYFGYHLTDGLINMSLALGAELDPDMLVDLIQINYTGKSDKPFNLSVEHLSAELYEISNTKPLILEYRDGQGVINTFTAAQNYPNPWTEQTSMNVFMPESGVVNLEVYNTNGQAVYSRMIPLEAGHQVVTIDSKDLDGSGLYHYKITNGKTSITRRFLLIE